jgi:hypothetical protein
MAKRTVGIQWLYDTETGELSAQGVVWDDDDPMAWSKVGDITFNVSDVEFIPVPPPSEG